MPAGLIQLVTYGTQDIFLTGTPQITFFKLVYRRHTNFSIESVRQTLDGIIDFDKCVSCTIDKNSDLVNKTYLEVILPEVHLRKKDLNPNFNPIQDIISNVISLDNFTNNVEDLEYAIALTDKRASQAIFLSFKVLLDHLMQMYLFTLNSINEGSDLDISKDINGLYPENSLPYNLFDNSSPFRIINVNENLYKILINYYKTNFELSPIEINELDSKKEFTYDFFYNSIIKRFYDPLQNNDVSVPEIVCKNLELKGLIQDFFDDTDNEFLDDDEREIKLLSIINKWYVDANEAYLFLQNVNKQKCLIVEDLGSEFVKFAWLKRIGHYIAEFIEIEIGGKRIDKHYSDWMNIWYELSKNHFHKENYNKMIGDVDFLTTYDNKLKPQYKLRIPLQFWFCRHNGLAIPLVSLRYHDVKINVKFRKLEECAIVENGFSLFEKINIVDASIWVDYIYLDSSERKRFARASHEYLIEQVQREEFKDVITTNITKELNFVHPTKELIWTCQANRYRINPTENNILLNKSNYTFSKENKGNPILNATLEFNTHTRLDLLDGNYFNYVQPYQNHSSTPIDGINVYSFAIKPEEQQPSGSVNFSRINFIVMKLNLDERIFNNENDINKIDEMDENKITEELANQLTGVLLTFYAPNYNVLRIMSGMAGIAFN